MFSANCNEIENKLHANAIAIAFLKLHKVG